MTFHGPTILKRSRVVWIPRVGEEVFEQVHAEIQIPIVHVTANQMKFSYQLRTDHRPVCLKVVAKIVTVSFHVGGHGMIDHAGCLVPERRWISIFTAWAIDRFPRILLAARPAFAA